jgi:general secretion pathway protein F
MGILPRQVESLREGKSGVRERPMKLEERSMVYHELGALLAAGLPMDRALDILVSTPEMAPHATALARFRDAVRDGAGVHEAVHRLDPAAGSFEQAMLQAGEASGRLPSTLGQVASYLEEERTLRENIVSSLLYPCIVVILALIAVVVISLVLFPTFQTMLREFGVKEPPLTRIVMGGGRLMAWVAPIMLGAVVVLGASAQRRPLEAVLLAGPHSSANAGVARRA